MAELEQLPGPLDLRIYRGDDANFQITLTDTVTGDPLVLPTTGWRAQARADVNDDTVLFTIAVDGSSAATGVVGVAVSGADTALVVDSNKVAWDLENTERERTYLAGSIFLKGQVSQ